MIFLLPFQKEILADILKMEEKEQFRKEMMQRLIPERDTNVQTQASGKQSQKNQGRPTVAQTRTSGLRNRTSGVEAKVNTGLRKSTWQKENTAIKTSVSIFQLWLRQRNQEYMSTGRHQFIILEFTFFCTETEEIRFLSLPD